MVHAAGHADLSDLIRDGTLRFALHPPMNFRHLDFPRYTVPLIEHDYQAKTPAMWNSAYRAFGMDVGNIVLVCSGDRLAPIFESLRRDHRYLGGGAGVGLKEKAFEIVDNLDPVAAVAGSVNFTSKTANGTLRGHNTDGIGYAVALERVLRVRHQELRGKTVLMVGAGGTACAVAFALAKRGARLGIVNRTAERAAALAVRVNAIYGQGCALGSHDSELDDLARTADIVVNVSTKGAAGPLAQYSALGPADLPLTSDSLRRNLRRANQILDRIPRAAILSDVVLVDGGTPFLRQAHERGFHVLDGVPMVINQAIEAFWILHAQELRPQGVTQEDAARVMCQAATPDAVAIGRAGGAGGLQGQRPRGASPGIET